VSLTEPDNFWDALAERYHAATKTVHMECAAKTFALLEKEDQPESILDLASGPGSTIFEVLNWWNHH
jgi:hypothetical protein